jgi:hypothetical protein
VDPSGVNAERPRRESLQRVGRTGVIGNRGNSGGLVDGHEIPRSPEEGSRSVDRHVRRRHDEHGADPHGLRPRQRAAPPDEDSTVAHGLWIDTRTGQYLFERVPIAFVHDPPDAPLRHARAPPSLDRRRRERYRRFAAHG